MRYTYLSGLSIADMSKQIVCLVLRRGGAYCPAKERIQIDLTSPSCVCTVFSDINQPLDYTFSKRLYGLVFIAVKYKFIHSLY
jgi:hypothetical protein